MGLTPLQGLVMGTRSGDIDPSIYMFLHDVAAAVGRRGGHRAQQAVRGLKGLCGDNDFRVIEQRIDARGRQRRGRALAVYAQRLRHYLGAGTRSRWAGWTWWCSRPAWGRTAAWSGPRRPRGLAHFGLELDAERNAVRSKQARIISTDSSPVTIMVVPTNEELAIARKAQKLVG